MSTQLLPNKGTPEWDAEVGAYLKSSIDWRESRAKELGFANRNSYQRAMLSAGVSLEQQPNGVPPPNGETTTEVQYAPYPKFEIKPFSIAKVTRDEEDIGIVWADGHAGRITDSYNPDIYKARFEYFLESTMHIINLHRPIRNAFIFSLGDDVQGENVRQGTTIGTATLSAKEQIYDLALPTQSRFIMSLKQGVKEVIVTKNRGNHGYYDKVVPRSTNWDIFLGEALKSALVNQKGITINVADQFYALTNIRGFLFFQMHGDQVISQQGIPFFALRRKYQEYYALFKFHYAYNGHWHSGGHDAVNSIADYTMCPPLITGDEWSLEKVGRASKPIQLVFGIHPQNGRTWEYKLYCDKGFLPVPVDGSIK